MALDTKTFDHLVSGAPAMQKALHIPPRCRLTPARILVLAMMSQSASRAEIRDTARTIRQTSQYGAQLRRVHVHSRLCAIFKDLHILGLAQASRRGNGTFQFILNASVRRRMNTYLRHATNAAASAE